MLRKKREIQSLRPEHERSTFHSGVEPLDRYLKELASQDLRRRAAAVFVLTEGATLRVLGYYTLSQSSLLLTDLPARVKKKLPRYPKVPATLLGRLAVDRSCQGEGLGEFLLMDALRRAWTVSDQVASAAVVVNVLQVEPDPLPFYLRYDFEPLPEQPRCLVLPFQRYQELFH